MAGGERPERRAWRSRSNGLVRRGGRSHLPLARGRAHQDRSWWWPGSLAGDKEAAAKLIEEIGHRYADRNGGYLRILKLGPRQGDNAPMARVELV